MAIYRVAGRMSADIALHVEALTEEDARLALMMLGQRMMLLRLDDNTVVGDFEWTDVTISAEYPDGDA